MEKGIVFVRSKRIEQAKQVPDLPKNFAKEGMDVEKVETLLAVPKRFLPELEQKVGKLQRVFAKSGMLFASSPQDASKYFDGHTENLRMEPFDPSKHYVRHSAKGIEGSLLLFFKSSRGALIYNRTMPLKDVCGNEHLKTKPKTKPIKRLKTNRPKMNTYPMADLLDAESLKKLKLIASQA